QHECLPECIAFVAQLAGLAAVIDRIAGRQDFCGLGLKFLERDVDARANARDLDRVELLKTVQAAWLNSVLERRNRGERNELSRWSAHMVIEQLIGIKALAPLNLRN